MYHARYCLDSSRRLDQSIQLRMNEPQNNVAKRIRNCLKPLETRAGISAAHLPRHSDYDLSGFGERQPLQPAAVMVPLVTHATGINVLLTQRTDHLQHHPGQVSFPGGRQENHDAGSVQAALRETEEEIGLERAFIEPIGLLDDYETVTGFLVTPVVSFITPGFELRLDDFEVADTFEVPLEFILDPCNQRIGQQRYKGLDRRYYIIEYQQRRIWGATAGMLMNLYRRLHGLSGPMRPD